MWRNRLWFLSPWFAPESLRRRARRIQHDNQTYEGSNRYSYYLWTLARLWEEGKIDGKVAEAAVRLAREGTFCSESELADMMTFPSGDNSDRNKFR